MKAILLIVLLHSGLAQQSDEEAEGRVSRLDARLQHVEQAIERLAQAMEDRLLAMERRMTARISPQEQRHCCDFASSMVRDFNQLHIELLDERSLAVDSKLQEMREDVQSAVDHVSTIEDRIAASNSRLTTQMDHRFNDLQVVTRATEERLTSNNVDLRENVTSLITEFTDRLTERIDDRISDWENRTRVGTSCKELRSRGHTMSGVYTIWSSDAGDMRVYCDMETEGGGWVVFQRRKDGSQDFFLTWAEYAAGFGDLNGEFWLGNRNLHTLTTNRPHELRIDLKDNGDAAFAKYSNFNVGSESDKFRLTISGYSGDAGDAMVWYNGMQFSTKDMDNDAIYEINCADSYKGAWWYNNCVTEAILNGLYLNGTYTGNARGIGWSDWKGYRRYGYSIQFAEMKIRPFA